ncbi:tyrosine--tRNA ligase [Methylocapsa sp. S129]|uniref:tyrosine--tRNA ligase n=1 Tax=Methylocapsa sp. S129 TaxID=1641869 RepID=UPI00131EB6DE|nr:tyrosine--tRNA ligase [Methylocapsa sp. S129]
MTDAFHPRSDFLATLQQRGFIHQCSNFEALDEKALSGSLIAYVGYDCTAPSLHIGNLVSIMMLHWLQKGGGKPIALMGGGTSMVGDPSGKDQTRKLLTVAQIDANKAGIRKVFSRFMTFGEGGTDAIMPDNAEWLAKLNYIEFLREIGSHLSVNRMLAMDSVKLRLAREQELSFLEFNYMCLQAYDFVELHRRYGCTAQMGGSDQWGNIIQGVELGRRLGAAQLFALTAPLITTASGAKMGKTAAGAIWLDAALLSPYDYWQFWRNTEDSDVGRFLRLFTLLPLDEISRLETLGGAEINEAKKILANEATGLLHGAEAAQSAAETARRTFEEGALAESLPTVDVPGAEFDAGLGVLAAFVRAGLVASTGEARRQIRGGGLRVNDEVVADERAIIGRDALGAAGVVKLSFGRKKHVLLRPN